MRLSFKGMKSSLTGVKLSGFTKMSLAVGGVLFFAWLGLTLFTGDGPKKSGPAKFDASKCPDCGRPLTKEAQSTGECPFCKMEDPTMQKKKARLGGGGVFQSRTIGVFIISTFTILLIANIAVFARAWWTKGTDEALYYLNCRKCDRRVRYREHQAGALARCPNCRILIRFPDAFAKPKGGWSVVKGWLTIPRKKAQKDSA